MRLRFVLVLLSLALSGCLFHMGWMDEIPWTKAELVEMYAKNAPNNPRIRRLGYCGSDSKYHYFIYRPVDFFVRPKVLRSELVIADERPRSALGRQWYFYLVDPVHNFRKVEESEVAR